MLAARLMAAASIVVGCGSDSIQPVIVAHDLGVGWGILSHRFSVIELTRDGDTVAAQNDGGDWGAVDDALATYGYEVWRSERLAAVEGSITIAIPPGAEVDGEAFAAEATLELPAGGLAGATALVAFVRGWRLSTNDYATPPPFASDPDLPYDPAYGFTSQGLGIALGTPALAGDSVSVPVRVRNSLAPSDRADMNGAIPQATTWMRVDVTVVGARAAPAAVTRGAVEYTLSFPTYGEYTVQERAPAAAQEIALQGAGGSRALFGVSAFDFWVNVPGRHDPACVVIQDEINSWGEMVSGPGRYVRSMDVRLWDTRHDASGAAAAKLDLFLSTSSYKEEGNLCLAVRGEVAMLEFDDPDAVVEAPAPIALEFESGERATAAIP